MGSPTPEAEADTERVLARSPSTATSPSSIVGALSAARENARGAREMLSAEIWESLNVTHNALPQQRTMARRYGPHSLFRCVRERLGDGGRAGRRHDEPRRGLAVPDPRPLARAGRHDRPAPLHPVWPGRGAVLDARAALQRRLRALPAHLPRHGRRSRAAEFLLLDRLFPRSVFAALEQAEACLAELERSTVRDAARIGVAGEAHRIVGRARTMLEFMSTPSCWRSCRPGWRSCSAPARRPAPR